MTNKELLELAAKAVNWKAEKWIESGVHLDGEPYGEYYATRKDDGVLIAWNPLTDDGDALRLAVKLGFDINIVASGTFIRRYEDEPITAEKNSDNPYAATRLAIVRAAAEIGRRV